MAGLIEKHEPSSVRKFLLSVQRGIRYVIRSTPGIFVQKCKYHGFLKVLVLIYSMCLLQNVKHSRIR